MLGTISGALTKSTAMYRVKQRTHVVISITRCWTSAAAEPGIGSILQPGCPVGSGRGYPAPLYVVSAETPPSPRTPKFHTFSTSLVGSVGSPYGHQVP